MPTIYCLGGASRSGKTTILRQFLATAPIPAISTDAMRHALKHLPDVNPNSDLFAQKPFATLSHQDRATFTEADAQRYITLQNKESASVWPAVSLYLAANAREGLDTLVEGVAVLPEYVAALPKGIGEVRAVFVGNQSDNHWRDMQNYAAEHPTDGLNRLSMTTDAEFQAFARLYCAFSSFVQAEAQKYGYPYIEMSEGNFQQSAATVVQLLQQ